MKETNEHVGFEYKMVDGGHTKGPSIYYVIQIWVPRETPPPAL